MQFSKIIGQKNIINGFINTVKTGRISHAQLLHGSEGSGKLELAIAYAQYVSCTNKSDTDSCGTCPSCKKYEKLIHPDLHFVYPVIKTEKFKTPVSDNFSKEWRSFILDHKQHRLNEWLEIIGTEGRKVGIFAHESSEIIRKLNLKTFESEYKIMIIWLPEKMNQASANKLLKMIEEPPMKTIFLLVSDFPEQIINTIRSRSQFVKIPKIDNQSLSEKIAETYQLEKNELNRVIKLGNGDYFKVLDIIEESDNEKYHFKLFIELMRLSFAAKIIDLTKWVDEISNLGREKQKGFLNYSLKMFRENFILNISPSEKEKLNQFTTDEENFSLKFSTFIHQNNIFDIYEEINKAHLHIERNGMDKIIFLDLALKLVKLLRRKAA
ncbi:MAG: DNA polymerase III subunit delta [Bacteroidetes bacterium]|nr:MAG: DNA polymerase III subunit delta [Bacteroidota bacterium]